MAASPVPVLVDGLWRCLCPSASNGLLLAKSVSVEALLAPPCRLRLRLGRRDNGLHQPRQARRWASQEASQAVSQPAEQELPPPSFSPPAQEKQPILTAASFAYYLDTFDDDTLKKAPYAVLYRALGMLRDRDVPNHRAKILRLVKFLVRDEHQPLNTTIAEALIAADTDVMGSANGLAFLLNEIAKGEFPVTKDMHDMALRVLAIHPDYLLRLRVLGDMKRRKVPVQDLPNCFIALGYLRDGQPEMALDHLDNLAPTAVPGWVMDIFIVTLTSWGHSHEAFRLLQRRLQDAAWSAFPPKHAMWYFLLDEWSKALHYEGTRLAWGTMVETGLLNPSDGMALNVINTASRHCEPDLALAAIKLLASRRVKLGTHHYEALLDSYAHGGNIVKALKVLFIMVEAGREPELASTRSILALLRRSPELADEAADLLVESKLKGRELHRLAPRVLIEAHCLNNDPRKALGVFKSWDRMSSSAPDLETFELIIAITDSAVAIRHLETEMKLMSIRPSAQMYERMMEAAMSVGDTDLAFLYVKKIHAMVRDFTPQAKLALLRLMEWALKRADLSFKDMYDWGLKMEMDIGSEVKDLWLATAQYRTITREEQEKRRLEADEAARVAREEEAARQLELEAVERRRKVHEYIQERQRERERDLERARAKLREKQAKEPAISEPQLVDKQKKPVTWKIEGLAFGQKWNEEREEDEYE
ncbi:hypothetical protein B0T26DRAFT_701842 [Lasiosphaeria miniovina]|uniref:Pentatricopeptide repeat-containing protein-mitochondrial domain-containing protein n=1 Tax=Lasiosphaeria miniovina TaxID=1954250 RepID=A0AA40AUH3_9PEZI|nr:uncharacterized protein B0T26DRAFT_701842 [Lasiosphaeria miniovina]KAK0722214.1 hypothetical protein B0T26DRAFT_701842 [Lasiosphaeria miniovina]